MNVKAANSDFRGEFFIRLYPAHFVGAVFSFFVKKWLFFVLHPEKVADLISANPESGPTQEPAMRIFGTPRDEAP